MTHYCAATNQPHLIVTDVDDDSVRFETDHVTKSCEARCGLHGEVESMFIDKDHIRTQWSSFVVMDR